MIRPSLEDVDDEAPWRSEPPLDPEPEPLPEYAYSEANGLEQMEIEQAENAEPREVEYVWPEQVSEQFNGWHYDNDAPARPLLEPIVEPVGVAGMAHNDRR